MEEQSLEKNEGLKQRSYKKISNKIKSDNLPLAIERCPILLL
jgi:hypothetical protein